MLIKLLTPHGGALLCFGGAFVVMTTVGNNRSAADLYLGTAGYVFGFCALLATLIAIALFLFRRPTRRRWPWLVVHSALTVAVVSCGHLWLATHLV
ncbi:MAG: hypothetical protein AAGJ94_03720 [Pseudomonadota bacterium]